MNRDISQTKWQSKRELVLDRDGFECQQCGKPEIEVESLHIHHKRPVSEGGSHELQNLSTMCESCHYEHHAEDRRNGTLADVKDIYLSAEAPVFRTKEINKKLPSSITQTTPKLKRLVEKGFLEKGCRGVYHLAGLAIDDVQPASVSYVGEDRRHIDGGVFVDGALIADGKYIGEEENIRQCDDCGRWYHSTRIETKMRKHQYNCTEQ